MRWRNEYENAHETALRQYKNGNDGSAVKTLLNFTDNFFEHFSRDIQNEDDLISAVEEIIEDINGILTTIDGDLEENRRKVRNKAMINTSDYNDRMLNEYMKHYWSMNLTMSEIRFNLGLGVLHLFSEDSKFGRKDVAMGKKGISMVNNEIDYAKSLKSRSDNIRNFTQVDIEQLPVNYKTRKEFIMRETKKRKEEEWNSLTDEERNEIIRQQNEEDYCDAVAELQKLNTQTGRSPSYFKKMAEDYEKLCSDFKKLSGHKDSTDLSNQCEEKIQEYKQKHEEITERERKPKQKAFIYLGVTLSLSLLGCYFLFEAFPPPSWIDSFLVIQIPFVVAMITTAIVLKNKKISDDAYSDIAMGCGLGYSIISAIIISGGFWSFIGNVIACLVVAVVVWFIGGLIFPNENK